MRDCYFIVADSNMEYAVRGMLSRQRYELTLDCGPFAFDPSHDLLRAVGDNDPGLYSRIGELSRPVRTTHAHLVVMLDAEWAGSPGAAKIRTDVIGACTRSGWSANDVAAIVIDPELENWIWQDNPIVERVVGHARTSLRGELAASGDWPPGSPKPPRPKEILEAVLRRNRVPRSSSLYREITRQVSLKGCSDPAFLDLRAALQRWFPAAGA